MTPAPEYVNRDERRIQALVRICRVLAALVLGCVDLDKATRKALEDALDEIGRQA